MFRLGNSPVWTGTRGPQQSWTASLRSRWSWRQQAGRSVQTAPRSRWRGYRLSKTREVVTFTFILPGTPERPTLTLGFLVFNQLCHHAHSFNLGNLSFQFFRFLRTVNSENTSSIILGKSQLSKQEKKEKKAGANSASGTLLMLISCLDSSACRLLQTTDLSPYQAALLLSPPNCFSFL